MNILVIKQKQHRIIEHLKSVLNVSLSCPRLRSDGSLWYDLLTSLPKKTQVLLSQEERLWNVMSSPSKNIVHLQGSHHKGWTGLSPLNVSGIGLQLSLNFEVPSCSCIHPTFTWQVFHFGEVLSDTTQRTRYPSEKVRQWQLWDETTGAGLSAVLHATHLLIRKHSSADQPLCLDSQSCLLKFFYYLYKRPCEITLFNS